MNEGVSHYRLNKKLKIQRYIKVCSTLQESEDMLRDLKNRNSPLGHLSVLGSVADFSEQYFGCTIAGLSRLTSRAVHLLHTTDLGSIFVSGSLSSILLERIDGKALGSLDGGLIGILNGYGVNHKNISLYLKHLRTGKLMVIAWDYDLPKTQDRSLNTSARLQKSR